MKLKLWKLPAALLVLGAALILSGCPISVGTQDDSMGGPGHLFGPARGIEIVVTGIPAGHASGTLTLTGEAQQTVYVTNGQLIFSFPGVTNLHAQRTVTLSGDPNVFPNLSGITTIQPPTQVPFRVVLQLSDFN